jgi:hypothetical protein
LFVTGRWKIHKTKIRINRSTTPADKQHRALPTVPRVPRIGARSGIEIIATIISCHIKTEKYFSQKRHDLKGFVLSLMLQPEKALFFFADSASLRQTPFVFGLWV